MGRCEHDMRVEEYCPACEARWISDSGKLNQAEAVYHYLRGEVEQKDAKFKAALDIIKGLLGLVDYRDVVIEKLRDEVERLEAQVIELAPVNFRCIDCGHEYAHFHTENSTDGDDCNFVDLSEDLE